MDIREQVCVCINFFTYTFHFNLSTHSVYRPLMKIGTTSVRDRYGGARVQGNIPTLMLFMAWLSDHCTSGPVQLSESMQFTSKMLTGM